MFFSFLQLRYNSTANCNQKWPCAGKYFYKKVRQRYSSIRIVQWPVWYSYICKQHRTRGGQATMSDLEHRIRKCTTQDQAFQPTMIWFFLYHRGLIFPPWFYGAQHINWTNIWVFTFSVVSWLQLLFEFGNRMEGVGERWVPHYRFHICEELLPFAHYDWEPFFKWEFDGFFYVSICCIILNIPEEEIEFSTYLVRYFNHLP